MARRAAASSAGCATFGAPRGSKQRGLRENERQRGTLARNVRNHATAAAPGKTQLCTAQLGAVRGFFALRRKCGMRAQPRTAQQKLGSFYCAGLFLRYGATAFGCAQTPRKYHRSGVASIALPQAVLAFPRNCVMMHTQPWKVPQKLGSFYYIATGCTCVSAQLRQDALRAPQSPIEAG